MSNIIKLPDIVGKGYGTFWRYEGRYLVVKGGRGSKKSSTESLRLIWQIMKYPMMNALVVRRYFTGLRDSCFAQLRWAINRLGVEQYWKATVSPMQLEYLPTGQMILFRGMDDPQSITSITVPHGVLNLVWIEEAFQIEKEEDFNKLDLSIRGEGAPYKQITLTFNPWDSHHWLKSRFYDNPDENTLALTTNYQCNEWLGEDDLALFDSMKTRNPRRYQVEGLGNWGISEGLIYTNWEEKPLPDMQTLLRKHNSDGTPTYRALYGMDFGFATDPTACLTILADTQTKTMLIIDEIYTYHATNQQLADMLQEHGILQERIIADSADPRTINELRQLGAQRIQPSKKGPDSIRAGIRKLQDWHIIVDTKCKNTITELSNYQWKQDRTGHTLPKPLENGYDHAMDALRYACEQLDGEHFTFEDQRGPASIWTL